MKKPLTLWLALIGFTSVVGQIVLMRELLTVFYGNELSMGVTLAGWLFWVAMGSWGFGRILVERIRQKVAFFAMGEVSLTFLLPLSVLAARAIPSTLNVAPGEVIGLLPMTFSSFLLLAPICLAGGFLFVLGCQVYSSRTQEEAAQIGWVYILEAIGATIGGLIASFILIRLFHPLCIMVGLGLINLGVAFSLRCERKRILFFVTGVLIIAFSFLLLSGGVGALRKASLGLQWRAHRLLASRNSVYGNVAVTQRENLYSFFNNGLYAFTVPDLYTAERNSHFPLLEHPRPRRVLLVGGGVSGILEEVLKHPVEKVDYVELDPLVIELAKIYLPENKFLADPRVRVVADMDGRLFIKRTRGKYDVVIINLPDPYTAQLNRFYTKEFYEEVKQILKDEGIVSFAMYSNPNYISEEQRDLFISLRETLREVFADVKVIPGETNYFLA